jgi:hypothetical protein
MANSNGWGDGAANNAIGWGQGANNNIGWGDSHAKSWAGATDIVGLTTDADAQAFITAAAITDATQQSAINNLVVGMKADGIWTKMKAIYPFVGGTASTHKYNLKDPRDLDDAFRLVFNGGWTHSSNGALPNGTNGYADTKLVPSSVIASINSAHISFYSRTNSDSACDIGVANSVGAIAFQVWPKQAGFRYSRVFSGVLVEATTESTSAYYINSRLNSANLKAYRNGSMLSNPTLASLANISSSLVLSARNDGGTIGNYSNRQTAFASIGDGLTDTEASNLYTRVQTYQTALSRQV